MFERSIEKKLHDLLARRGALCLKFVSPGNRGVPDRVVIAGGRVMFVELKAPTGMLSPVQQWQIERLRKRGADVRVLRGPDQVEEFVEELFA